MSKRTSLIQIHCAALLAGATALFGKFLDVSPTVITCGRTLCGALTLLVVITVTNTSLRIYRRWEAFMLLLSGLLWAVHWITFFKAVQVSSVAICLLAFSTYPVFVTFLEPFVFGEKLHRRDVLMAALVVFGLVLVTPRFDLGNQLTQGLLWGVLSAFTCAWIPLLSRSFVRTYPPLTVAFYQQATVAVVTLPFLLQAGGSLTNRDLLLLLLLGTVFTALTQALVAAGLRHLRAQTVSIIFALEPVYGILLACVLLGEIPTFRMLVGGVIIGLATAWATLRPHAAPSHQVT